MWLAVPFVLILLFVVIGAGLAGGIYTIVFIPIVAIVLIAMAVTMMLRRPKDRPSRSPGTVGWAPPPGGAAGGGAGGGQTPPEPDTPEDVLRERRDS